MASEPITYSEPAHKDVLVGLLARYSNTSITFESLDKTQIKIIFTSLTSLNTEFSSLALAILARYFNHIESPQTPSFASSLIDMKEMIEDGLLRSIDVDVRLGREGVNALIAIFKVHPKTAVSFIMDDKIQQSVETVIAAAMRQSLKGPPLQVDLYYSDVFELLSLAAGQSSLRVSLREGTEEWLDRLVSGALNCKPKVKGFACLTLVKLAMGKETEAEGGKAGQPQRSIADEEEEVKKLIRIQGFIIQLISEFPTNTSTEEQNNYEPNILPALEALAYTTLPSIHSLKLPLTASPFLSAFYRLLPSLAKSNAALEFAIATLISNLVNYPKLEEDQDSEEAQIFKLKAFAAKKSGASDLLSRSQETIENVNERINNLLYYGKEEESVPSLMETLNRLVNSSSFPTRKLVEKIFLSIVEQQSTRGRLLQSGIAKSLLLLIRRNSPSPSQDKTAPSPPFSIDSIPPIQALAKLLITTSPTLVFPGNSGKGFLLESVRNLILPLSLNGINLLIKFESIMALTNLASLDEETVEFISSSPITSATGGVETTTLMETLSTLLLSTSNTLLTRATLELICNLVNSPSGTSYYSPSPSTTIAPISNSIQPYHSLLPYLHSVDIPTALASSGALAGLVYQSKMTFIANDLIQKGREKEFEIVLGLLKGLGSLKKKKLTEKEKGEDEGLKLRGLDICSSILNTINSMDVGSKEKEEGLEKLKEMRLKERIVKLVEIEGESLQVKGVGKEILSSLK